MSLSSQSVPRVAIRASGHVLQRGFTIIEIMVVVVIIGILAAAVGPKLFGQVGKARANTARQDIKTIEQALKIYRLDNFTYPTSEQGLNALVERPNDPNLTNWDPEGYLERAPVDPWKRPYEYLNPGQRGDIDIFSLGADGRPGGEGENADIGNWDE
ncbi:MAG: type II secretion system major pseudopilin GspG [Pseudomonadota bacterium]